MKILENSSGFDRSNRPTRGFALIVTLSLMILLTVVAVGLLTLSSISMRSISQGEPTQIARANARLAMIMAIGDLQKLSGKDTRITARADILDASNPPVVGVWKSWEGTDHEITGSNAGRPISPGSDYKTVKNGRFLGWLVSGDPTVLNKSGVLPSTQKTATSVTLLGANSVGTSPALQIHLPPTPINLGGKKGRYAWWVGGENQKARLPNLPTVPPASQAEWAGMLKSNSTVDPLPFKLESLLTTPSLASKAVSLRQVDLIDPAPGVKTSVKHFHDLSTTSVGLLTNTATGGWRKDLSLFTENYGLLANTGLPLFRLSPDADNSCSIPKGSISNFRPGKSILYPWSDYRGSSNDRAIYQHGAAASWENLKDYALLYQNSSPFSIAARSIRNDGPNNIPADTYYNFLHKVRILPVIARVQWVFSHSAGLPAAPPAGSPPYPPGSLTPRLLVTPVITFWNPYSVKINCTTGYKIRIPKPLPPVLQYTVNGQAYTKYRSLTKGSTNYSKPPTDVALSEGTSQFVYFIEDKLSLNPGQTIVYSPKFTAAVAASGADMIMAPGFRKTGGHFFTVLDDNNKPVVAPASSTFKASAKFDNAYADGANGVGIYLDMISSSDNAPQLVYRMVLEPAVADLAYPKLDNLSAATLSQAQSNPVPFLSTMFGARLASNTHIPAKGFLQTSPLVNFTAMGGKDVVEPTIKRHYGGTRHPVNSPFDYSFVAHTGLDSYFPNVSGDSGYIVSGFTSGNGLSRCIAAEIPTRPLASLAELQHWDLRYENPIPPYSFNVIANSDATPLLPANAVVNGADAGLATNLQHDDSYCANHLLFDDWFFSSIAAGNAAGFGRASSLSLEKPYSGFVTEAVPLINRQYKPLPEDAAFARGSTAESRKFLIPMPPAESRFPMRAIMRSVAAPSLEIRRRAPVGPRERPPPPRNLPATGSLRQDSSMPWPKKSLIKSACGGPSSRFLSSSTASSPAVIWRWPARFKRR